jgi:nucleoside-triphosphatase THEP1
MSYALVIGNKDGRKSIVMREIADALAGRGVRVAGFTQRTSEQGPGRKAVEVVRLRDAASVRLACTTTDPGSAAGVCSFAFDANAFAESRRWIEEDVAGADVIVLDGLGKLELGGGGHRATIEHALRAGPLVVLSVKEDVLVYALEALALEEPIASLATGEGSDALDGFVAAVAGAVDHRRRAAL